MKYFILLIALLTLSFADAQNITIPARGRISDQDNGSKLSGVRISLLHNGSEISSSQTSSNGRYQLQGSGPKTGAYTLVYSKSGYVSKKIQLDLNSVNEEDLPAGNAVPIPELDIDLFAERENADFSFLESEPVASFFWDSNNFLLDFDRAASNKTKRKIDNLLAKSEKEAAENEAKYNEAITAGDMFFAQQKYEKAVEKFEEALQYKPKAEYPIEKLDELDALIQAQKEEELVEQQANAKYNELIEAADQLRDSDQFEQAIAKYNEAVAEKDEQYPKDQISLLEAEIEKRKNEAENQVKYDAAIQEADQLFTSEDLENARTKYEEASGLKPSENYPKEKIDEIEKLLKDKQDQAQKDAEYQKLIDEGDASFAGKSFDDAISKYEAALKIKSDEAYPKDQIALCKKNLEDLKSQEELAGKIEKLMSEGDLAMTGDKFEEAIAKFEEVLSLDNTHVPATEKLALAKQKLEDQKNAEQADADFNRLVEKGDEAVSSESYQEAIDAYKAALDIKNDAVVTTKLKDAQTKIAELAADKEKREQFDKLMQEGAQAMSDEAWEQAKTKYNGALLLYSEEQKPKDKLAEIEEILADQEAAAEKNAEYQKFIDQADALFANNAYEEAIDNYRSALQVKENEKYPTEQIAICEQKLDELKSEAEMDAKISALMDEGLKAMAEDAFENAINKFEEVLELKDDHLAAKENLAEARKALNDEKGEAEQAVEFARLVEEGDNAVTAEDYAKAVDAYAQALDIKKEVSVEVKLKDAQSKLNALNAEKDKRKEYDLFMTEGAQAMNSKNWDKAKANFNNALGVYPDEQEPKDKLAEIESLMSNELADAEKDEEYRKLMDAGDKLMSEQNYVDAINKFNDALSVKPNEKEPVEKAAEAQRLAEEANKDADKLYEKILTTAEQKAIQGDYDRARELVERAKQNRPEDDRPDKILKLIVELIQKDQEYAKLMSEGESLANSKQYNEAKAKFIGAKEVKPDEQLPPQRIADMEKLISESASQAEKETLYNQYMAEGQEEELEESYENALSAYKNALNVRPNDSRAQDKVDEIQQILDNFANQKASDEEKEEAYRKAIERADNAFSGERYIDAKNAYDDALGAKPGDEYATGRLEESVRRENKKSLVEAEEQYQNILRAADKNFDEKNYEKAREYYTRALNNRATDPYPKQRLEEIDRLLNPAIQDSDDLTDLGMPFSGSILDGEVLLRKADQQRVRNKTEGVLTTVDGITEGEADLTEKKKGEHQETTNEIYMITEGIIARSMDDIDQLYDNSMTIENSMVDLERSTQDDVQLEYRETVGHNEVITAIDQEHALDYKEKEEVYLDNTDIVDNYNIAQEKALSQRMTAEQGANIFADQELTEVDEGIRSEVIDDYETRERAARLAEDIQVGANKDFEFAQRREEANTQETHVVVEEIEMNYEEKYVEGHEKAIDNTEEFKKIDNYLVDKEDYMSTTEDNSLKEKDKEVQAKEAKAYKAQEGLSQNREENAEILDKSTIQWDEDSRKVYNDETEKYLSNVDNIQKSIDSHSEIDEVAEAALDDKIEYSERMEKKTLNSSKDFEAEDKENRTDAVKVINDIEVDYNDNEDSQEARVRKNAPIVEGVEMDAIKDQTDKSETKKDEILNAKQEIDKITDDPKEKAVVVNELGKEYPAGVSQEVFTKQDQNGLMTELITRRIVVVDGHADVYIRTQTSHGTTYTKNGNPSLEHVWQAQTQNPRLERHF
jgi:tetratricopeptide (TPR) repeat protein